ncbi:MAG: hypothetical protein HN623_13065, partial [Bdellovibrionales bacterium]|nr:hypothetical protein [Bdellovibrionales bacterium]
VRKLLVKQRAKVQQLVRQRLRQAATKMAERLSRKLQVAHEFKLGSLGDILDNSAVAQLALERLRLSEQGMMVQFAAGLPAASSTFNLTTLKDEFFNDNLTSDPSRWGFIGINPSLINALVQLAIPVRGEFRQLTGRGNLDIDAFFDADALSELIPDLMNLDGGQRSLQAHYRLLSSPQLGIDQSGLFLKLPTIELLLMVWYEDEWQPYYHFLIDLTPELSFVDQGGEIKLQVATTRDVMVRGGWERSFPIGRPDVNHQLFGDILKELLSMDDSLPILATFKKPKIEFDGVSLRSEAVVTPPFFGITLFK